MSARDSRDNGMLPGVVCVVCTMYIRSLLGGGVVEVCPVPSLPSLPGVSGLSGPSLPQSDQGWLCRLSGARENITVCGVAPVPASTHRVS